MIYAKFLDIDGFWRKAAFEEGLPIEEKYHLLSEEECSLLRNGYVFDREGNVVPRVIVVTEVMVRQEAATRLEMIASPYQPQERETWEEQVKEAEMILNQSFEVDSISIPIITARAKARNITIEEMANIIIEKRNTYKTSVAKILAAQDVLINLSPIPEDFREDKYWV